MATDNHRDTAVLFPDPQENFDHPRWQPDTELDAVQTHPVAEARQLAVHDPSLYPDATPERHEEDPFVDDDSAVTSTSPAAPDRELAPPTPADYLGDDAEFASAPHWVSMHIPADRLVMDEPNRRFRRRPTSPAPHATDVDGTPTSTPPTATRPKKSIPIGWTAAAVLAAASLIGAAVVVIGNDESPPATTAAMTPEPSQIPRTTATTPATTPAAAPWCTVASTADATTTDAAGGRDSAVGVIAAFEHAYYVERSGAAVAALMTSPAPAERIQAVIDRTPAGTEHCVTIAATDIPDVHAVALALRTPSGSESAIASRITTTDTGAGYAIANVEEVR